MNDFSRESFSTGEHKRNNPEIELVLKYVEKKKPVFFPSIDEEKLTSISVPDHLRSYKLGPMLDGEGNQILSENNEPLFTHLVYNPSLYSEPVEVKKNEGETNQEAYDRLAPQGYYICDITDDRIIATKQLGKE